MTDFTTREKAEEWMTAQVDDPYRDNERFAFLDDPAAVAEYDRIKKDGCCGYFDERIAVNGRAALIGCNYGH